MTETKFSCRAKREKLRSSTEFPQCYLTAAADGPLGAIQESLSSLSTFYTEYVLWNKDENALPNMPEVSSRAKEV